MDSTGEKSEDFWLASILNLVFKEQLNLDRLERVRGCFVNGILSHGQEIGQIRVRKSWGNGA